jgi:hypothetical protein
LCLRVGDIEVGHLVVVADGGDDDREEESDVCDRSGGGIVNGSMTSR